MNLLVENWDILVPEVLPEHLSKDVMQLQFTEQVFQAVCNIQDVRLTNKDKQNPHGKQIIDIFEKENRLSEFIKMWRVHFLENNDVKYLPQGWRVDHKMERNFGPHSVFNKNYVPGSLGADEAASSGAADRVDGGNAQS